MSTSTKLAAFTVGVVAAFGAAFGLGRAVGPIGTDRSIDHPAHPEATTTTGAGDAHAGHASEEVGS